MKVNIHPKWYPEARVTCTCGNTFVAGSTVPQIHVEVCSHCHPFYTGEARFVDIKGRVERFREIQARKRSQQLSKKEKRVLKKQKKVEEERKRPGSLKEVRQRVGGA